MSIFIKFLSVNYLLYKNSRKRKLLSKIGIIIQLLLLFTIPMLYLVGSIYDIDEDVNENLIKMEIVTYELLIVCMMAFGSVGNRYIGDLIIKKDLIVHYPISNVKQVVYSVFGVLSDPVIIACIIASILISISIEIGYIFKIVIFITIMLTIINIIIWSAILYNPPKIFSLVFILVFLAVLIGMQQIPKLSEKYAVFINNWIHDIKNGIYIVIVLAGLLSLGICLAILFHKKRIPQTKYTE